MSVKILVTDRNNRPIANAKVFVKWQSGTSTEYTNSTGVADLRCSGGLIESISVNNYSVHEGRIRVGDNDTMPVQLNR